MSYSDFNYLFNINRNQVTSERIIQLSPNFTLTLSLREKRIKDTRNNQEYDFDNEIASTLVFQDRMQGWFFKPALELLNNNYAMASVHLVTPLIEALEIYHKGEAGSSKSDFTNQAKQIFTSLSKNGAITFLYHGVRCGFAHKGFPQGASSAEQRNIVISLKQNNDPIVFESNCLTIYARPYVESIQKAFEEFYEKIKTDSEARDKFRNVWSLHWNMKKNSFGHISEDIPDDFKTNHDRYS
ncbi:MAG: hypothetical protein AUK48_07650 [Oscillatoriales cyanobacterium CG2_30_44_21]|nr:MAG: hypothetical protein AUK48_07650 [Oscillatoriales cyanobacterium CG2_30_44_21]